KEAAKNSLVADYPVINEKKVMLYAPTYRDNELDIGELKLDIEKMYQAFKHDYVLLLRLHPAINGEFQNKYPGFVINVSGNYNINHLLVITDILITDYSSIPFEFSLLNKPMVFFAYDLDQYAIDRGFWETYEDLVPGPVVENTNDLVDVIRNRTFDLERIKEFASQWNQFSQGASCKRLIQTFYTEMEGYSKVMQR